MSGQEGAWRTAAVLCLAKKLRIRCGALKELRHEFCAHFSILNPRLKSNVPTNAYSKLVRKLVNYLRRSCMIKVHTSWVTLMFLPTGVKLTFR
ncbi:hypothetical protein TNCT_182921 [Trichonephila clavata]|uniref:Uncharacterized protein n=1 Tax=Trichonephila clavata TaxID=2740835 RepID=A0A8X6L581_TRICU|nr:hypothetical protein TNCT_182921 [Trichonephila clavata]